MIDRDALTGALADLLQRKFLTYAAADEAEAKVIAAARLVLKLLPKKCEQWMYHVPLDLCDCVDGQVWDAETEQRLAEVIAPFVETVGDAVDAACAVLSALLNLDSEGTFQVSEPKLETETML